MIKKRLEILKNTVNKYMADIRPVRMEVSRKSTIKCIFTVFDSGLQTQIVNIGQTEWALKSENGRTRRN
jgi:hypothetical protein